MEKRSKHPMDVYNWIKKVIDSYSSYKEHMTILKLIYQFCKIYPNYSIQGYELRNYLDSKVQSSFKEGETLKSPRF